ncbi:MAG: vitamin K epoxide reductase family protein [Parcubacteria group bacterium]|nr:vitamin K epoxide reductase family protein [Parcubacteria group bacterium]
MRKNARIIFLFSAFTSIIGFADAAYLTLAHYRGATPVCSIINGCEKVLTSSYSTIFGIPVALFGVIIYAIIFIATLFYYGTGKKQFFIIYALSVSIAFLASLYFLSIQFFVLSAFCFYCLIFAAASIILFILLLIYRYLKI